MSTQTAELTSHRDLTPVLDKLSALAISRPNRYDKAQSSPAASPPPDYLKHQKEWNTMSADFEARMKWLDNLEADRGLKYVDTFLKYMREHPEPPRSQVKEVANDAFMSWLNEADWIHNNEALGIVNERLWSRYISAKPNLYIGCYQDAVLALRLNGRALDPPKADIATCKKYAITSINPHSLLAIRYKPLDEKDRVERVFLFVTLGNICLEKSQGGWDDTDFLLLLEIQNSGKRGRFYVLYDSGDSDRKGGLTGGQMDESIPKFPTAPAAFSPARITPDSITLKRLDLERLAEDPIDLEPVSTSTIEITETGMKQG